MYLQLVPGQRGEVRPFDRRLAVHTRVVSPLGAPPALHRRELLRPAGADRHTPTGRGTGTWIHDEVMKVI